MKRYSEHDLLMAASVRLEAAGEHDASRIVRQHAYRRMAALGRSDQLRASWYPTEPDAGSGDQRWVSTGAVHRAASEWLASIDQDEER